MSRSAWGAFIGFIVALVVGIFLGYFILDWVSSIMDHAEIVIIPVLIVIPILAFFGAIIGYFLGKKKHTVSSSSGINISGTTRVMLKVIFGVIGAILLISGFILTFFDVGQSAVVVPIFDIVFYVTPLGITFLVLGIIVLAVVTKGECCDCG